MDAGFKKILDDLKIKLAVTHPEFCDGTIAVIKDLVLIDTIPLGTCVTMHTVRPAAETVLVSVPKDQLHAIQQQFPNVVVVEPARAEPGVKKGYLLVPTPQPAPTPKPSPLDEWDKLKTEISDPLSMVVLGRLDQL